MPEEFGLYKINGMQRYSLDMFLRRTDLILGAVPRSLIDSILGLNGLVVQRVAHNHDIHVWILNFSYGMPIQPPT